MTHTQFMKQAMDQTMPDLDDVRRRVLASTHSTAKPRTLRRLAPALVCALVLAVGLSVLPHQRAPQPAQGTAPQPGGVTQPATAPTQPEPEQAQSADTVHIAELEELGGALSKDNRIFPPDGVKSQMSEDEFLTYLGVDLRPKMLPEGMSAWSSGPHDVYRAKDGTVLYDQAIFSYAAPGDDAQYDPLRRRLDVTFSKIADISDCCVYVWPADMLTSTVGGVEMKLGHQSVPYGPYTVVENGPNTPSGYYHRYVAEFTCQGVHVQVVAENFTDETFVQTLSSMVKS